MKNKASTPTPPTHWFDLVDQAAKEFVQQGQIDRSTWDNTLSQLKEPQWILHRKDDVGGLSFLMVLALCADDRNWSSLIKKKGVAELLSKPQKYFKKLDPMGFFEFWVKTNTSPPTPATLNLFNLFHEKTNTAPSVDVWVTMMDQKKFDPEVLLKTHPDLIENLSAAIEKVLATKSRITPENLKQTHDQLKAILSKHNLDQNLSGMDHFHTSKQRKI